MTILLVQGCSKSKKPANGPIPALDLYTGYFYKIIEKAKREGEFRSDLDLRILSAKYGVIHPEMEIEPYDLRMNHEIATELHKETVNKLSEIIKDKNYEYVVLNLGAEYKKALEGLQSKIDVPVVEIQGQLGQRGQTLKQFVRGEDQLEVPA